MKYDKLVRDKIPEILKAGGKAVVSHTANEAEYWQKLKDKLIEEATEFSQDETEAELADVLEVMQAICQYKEIDWQRIEKGRQHKFEERGGFEKRIVLDEVR